MGNLLQLLFRKADDGSAAENANVFVDFENCRPTEQELPVWQEVNQVLQESATILDHLQQYQGAAREIREAISNPHDDTVQQSAWRTLHPLVNHLREFYVYSTQLEKTIPKLLSALNSQDMTAIQHLECQQALFKQFAQVLDFVLRFDDLKMTNPSIQNDFSYYRRTMARQRSVSEEDAPEEQSVNNEMANKMSLFYATPTPMMKVLSDVTTRFVTENKDRPLENTTDCLSAMCNICKTMIENPEYRSKFEIEETVMFCLRVMVGVIILYDHVHHVGAFAKTSPINIKGCVKLIKEQPNEKVENLLNSLRYNTRHLNDETTPRQVRESLS